VQQSHYKEHQRLILAVGTVDLSNNLFASKTGKIPLSSNINQDCTAF